VWGAAIAAFGGAQGVWFEVEAGAALAVVGLFSAVDRFVLGSTVRRSKAAFDQTGKEFVLAVDDMGVSWATDLVSWRFAWPITRLVEAGDQVLFTTKSDGMIGVSRSLLDDDQLATLRTIAESHRGEYLSEADRRQATAEVITPGWYPDPTGRHEERFRDSQGWRQSVRDGGVQGRDRL